MIITLLLLLLATPSDDEKLTEHTLQLQSSQLAAQAELAEFKFLQGAWRGTGFGADCDEMWTTPAGDCMLGTFRMVKDGQLQFTEFCMIHREDRGGIVLRLKHFNPDFSGWEEKTEDVSFPLVKVESKAAYFQGLTYKLQADGSLSIWVALKNEDGTYAEESFQLKPVN
ncbi:MAG: DUF6265 family protein [Planctomycetota bacterium]